MSNITMQDVKHLDCEVCGHRMNYLRSDDNMTVRTYCDEKDHPEYEYDLTNDDHYFGLNKDERIE